MIICRRCGHANKSTETFCTSCGTFLKWSGESVDPAPDDARLPDDPPRPDDGSGPVTGPGPALDPTPAPPDADMSVVCPVCGRPNERDRTFCRTCGERLVPERVERVVVVEPARIRPSGSWPIVAVVLVIGTIAVVAVLGLRSLGISASSPAAGDSSKGSDTSASSGPPTPTPTTRPEPIELEILSVKASSSPKGPAREPDRYAPEQAIDGSLETSWQEGEPDEAGEWIEVEVAPATLDHVVLFNGWQLKDDAFYANRRLRDIQILVDGEEAATAALEDSFGPQNIELGGGQGTTIRIVIVSTYDSEARPKFSARSPFDDAALSEIQVFGTPVK